MKCYKLEKQAGGGDPSAVCLQFYFVGKESSSLASI
jgi:hypothetical protein